jgi:hypothetical protein
MTERVSWTDARGREHKVTPKVKKLLDSKWRGQSIKGDAKRVMEFFEEVMLFYHININIDV